VLGVVLWWNGIMKYWLTLVAAVVVVALVAIGVSTRFATKERRFERVHEGMSRDEVVRIMGPPEGRGIDEPPRLFWRGRDRGAAFLVVIFDEDGFVVEKTTFTDVAQSPHR
jgi:hypothetical protein